MPLSPLSRLSHSHVSHTRGDSRIRTCIARLFRPPLYRWSYIPFLIWLARPEPGNGIEPLSTDYKSAALPLCYTGVVLLLYAAREGLEPSTPGLTSRRSAIELPSLSRLSRLSPLSHLGGIRASNPVLRAHNAAFYLLN